MGSPSTGKSKSKSSSENWGMGFLLVFFPEDDTSSIFNKKKNSSSISLPSSANIFKRSNSYRLILTKAQSTISICALLVFFTLLLFTLSTFEPTPNTSSSRRHLSEKPNTNFHNSPSSWVVNRFWQSQTTNNLPFHAHALQRMGSLFMRGTKAMNDLIVVHALEDDSLDQVRVFLRLLHRSGLTSKADVVFLFPPSQLGSSSFNSLIKEETDSFLKLVTRYQELNDSVQSSFMSFDVSQFMKSEDTNNGKKKKKKDSKEVRGEAIWGRKNKSNDSEVEAELNYGSVVSFDSSELDPENSLAGFLDHVPMSLRRWACYPMLLGRVRRNYKHIMLVELNNFLILGDPLVRVRNRSPESVFLSSSKRKSSDKTRLVNSGIIMGGSRGIRRFSGAMLTEIVRAAMQYHKGKHLVTESSVLNQLVRNEFILKDAVNLITSTESIPDTSSLGPSMSNNSGSSLAQSRHPVVQRANSNNHELDTINSIIMKKICAFSIESSVYRDCAVQIYKKEKL